MNRIIGIGNALVDVLVRLQNDNELEALGLAKGGMRLIDEKQQEFLAKQLKHLAPERATGGSAGNAILALANLGAKPGFIGCIGTDEMGVFYRNNCLETGIDARLLERPGQSGVANTFISPDAERTFATYLGVAGQLSADDVVPSLFLGYQILHIEGYLVQDHDLITRVCQTAHQLGMTTSIDLASYNVVADNLTFLRQLVGEYIDIVFANEEESAAFTKGKVPEAALEEIAQMSRVAVVKLGKRGAKALSKGQRAFVSGRVVGVVDTTAAGDFFAGGFLYGLSQGASLEQCLQLGALLSQHIIQVVGTRLPETTWQTIRCEAQNIIHNS